MWSPGRLQLPALSLTRTLSVWLPMPLIVADGVVWVVAAVELPLDRGDA